MTTLRTRNFGNRVEVLAATPTTDSASPFRCDGGFYTRPISAEDVAAMYPGASASTGDKPAPAASAAMTPAKMNRRNRAFYKR